MKKRKSVPIIVLVIILAILIVATAICCFMPKAFGRAVDPSDVDHINIVDGNTGVRFVVDDQEDIRYIIENIQSKSLRRSGISIGRMGYLFSISYADNNDKTIIPAFFINGEDTIRKDPFFYRCEGGLCVDYLKELEKRLDEGG